MVLNDDLSLQWQNCSEELLSSLLMLQFQLLGYSMLWLCNATLGEKKKREKIADMLFGAKNKNKSFHLFIFYLKQRFIGPVQKWIMDMQTAEQKQ